MPFPRLPPFDTNPPQSLCNRRRCTDRVHIQPRKLSAQAATLRCSSGKTRHLSRAVCDRTEACLPFMSGGKLWRFIYVLFHCSESNCFGAYRALDMPFWPAVRTRSALKKVVPVCPSCRGLGCFLFNGPPHCQRSCWWIMLCLCTIRRRNGNGGG